MSGVYVNFGCGLEAPETWQNFDFSVTLRLQRLPLVGQAMRAVLAPRFPYNAQYGDIVKGLMLDDSSCDLIYCSHVLEHLPLEELRQALRNVLRYLKPGGTFRFVFPDLEYHINEYVNSDDAEAVHHLMQSTLLGKTQIRRDFVGVLRRLYGGSSHYWLWDYKGICKELSDAGFSSIRRAEYGDSEHKVFRDVEEFGRWQNCLGLECRKPS